MRVLIYEFVTGGGYLAWPTEAIPTSLLTEGYAMVNALAGDFLALPDVEIGVLVDHRLTALPWSHGSRTVINSDAQGWSSFSHLARIADWTVVIAPEFDDQLHSRVRTVEGVGGKLLGPGGDLVQLATDKSGMCAYLADMGIPVPRGKNWHGGTPWLEGIKYPAVLKPRYGAGSQDIRLLESAPATEYEPVLGSWRIEEYCTGTAASVALVCGSAGHCVLRPCQQRLSDDGQFQYLGGSIPLAPDLDQRARKLGERIAVALPSPHGYIGIDLVLGHEPDGSGDRVIEVNPRLTTSYVGLRSACRQNLAGVMLDVAEGRTVALNWNDEPLEFSSAGEVWRKGITQ